MIEGVVGLGLIGASVIRVPKYRYALQSINALGLVHVSSIEGQDIKVWLYEAENPGASPSDRRIARNVAPIGEGRAGSTREATIQALQQAVRYYERTRDLFTMLSHASIKRLEGAIGRRVR